MLSGVVRNWCENYTEHQSFEECLQHLDCLETSYRAANWIHIHNEFYTKVPGEHHEQLLCCLQKAKKSGNCRELLLQSDQIVLFQFKNIKVWLIKNEKIKQINIKALPDPDLNLVAYFWQ